MGDLMRRLPTFYETQFAFTTDKLRLIESTLLFMQLLCLEHYEGFQA